MVADSITLALSCPGASSLSDPEREEARSAEG